MIEDSVQAPNLGASALTEVQDLIPEQPNLDLTPENSNEISRFKKLLAATTRVGHLATRGAQTALVLLEVSPANEAVRLSAWGAAEAVAHNPVAGALSLGLSTLGVEAVGALAGAPLLDTGPSKRVANFLNEKLSKVSKDSEQPEFSQLTKVGTAYVGGSVAAMALDKIENPDNTVEHSRRFGLWTSAWLAGVLAVQGAAGSEGASLLGLSGPEAAGIVVGAVGTGATGGWLKRRFNRHRQADRHANYDSLVAERMKDYPQQQGLGIAEFTGALKDPTTASSDLEAGGKTYEVPQLMSLKHVKWLNEDFYARRFPEEHSAGAVKFYNNKLDLEASEQLQTSLKDLAAQGGVVVFDYSESDPEYLAHLQELLEGLGIEASDFQELGTQTYYAGKVNLKRSHQERSHPEGLISTFEEMVQGGNYDKSRFVNGASLHRRASEDTAQDMNKLYTAAYKVLNDHPCRQGLSPSEFSDMATKDEEVAKLVYSQNGQAQSMCILGEDLSKFEWLNPEFYRGHYPEEYAHHQIAYFPAIATDPSKQGQHNSEAMINLIAEICEAGDNEILVAFDACDINKGFLDKLLENMINETPEAAIKFSVIDQQRYGALKLSTV